MPSLRYSGAGAPCDLSEASHSRQSMTNRSRIAPGTYGGVPQATCVTLLVALSTESSYLHTVVDLLAGSPALPMGPGAVRRRILSVRRVTLV